MGNRNLEKTKYGFSLIEMSIVIAIIATFIIGAIQGGKLVQKAKIAKAASMTKSSIVKDMDGLILWFETTMPNSLDQEERSNNGAISTWYDISEDEVNGNNATQATEENQPSYISSSINSLPVISFDGNDLLSLTNNKLSNSYHTFLIVEKRANDSQMYFFGSAVTPYSGIAIGYQDTDSIITAHYKGNPTPSSFSRLTPAFTSPQAKITSITFGKHQSNIEIPYVCTNGVCIGAVSSPHMASARSDLQIGHAATAYYTGEIGEIIVFNRKLTAQELSDVEKYLTDKWGL